MTCQQFDALLARSNGRCELCSIPAAETRRGFFVIDHDHKVGMSFDVVRGLVCDPCNGHMRRIDSGERPMDDRTRAYLARAQREGTTLTAVLIEKLEEYGRDDRPEVTETE